MKKGCMRYGLWLVCVLTLWSMGAKGQQKYSDSLFFMKSDGSFVYHTSAWNNQGSRQINYFLSFTPQLNQIGYLPYYNGFLPARNRVLYHGLNYREPWLIRNALSEIKIYTSWKPLSFNPSVSAVVSMDEHIERKTDSLMVELFGTSGKNAIRMAEFVYRKNLSKRNIYIELAGNYIYGKEDQINYSKQQVLNKEGKLFLETHPATYILGKPYENGLDQLSSAHFSKNDNQPNADFKYQYGGMLKYNAGKRNLFIFTAWVSGGKTQLYIHENALLNATLNPIKSNSNQFVSMEWKHQFRNKHFSPLEVKLYANYAQNETMHPTYKGDFFRYGHNGKFHSVKNYNYTKVGGSGQTTTYTITHSPYTGKDTNYQVVLDRHFVSSSVYDSILLYTPGNDNVQNGLVNSFIDNDLRQKNLWIRSQDHLNSLGGLRNGDMPMSYHFLNPLGYYQTDYTKNAHGQQGILVAQEADYISGNYHHKFNYGLQLTSSIERSYSLNAVGLWSLMRQLASAEKVMLDSNDVTLKIDPLHQSDSIIFGYKSKPSSANGFMKNLRQRLISQKAVDANGKLVNSESAIETDNYTPDNYALDLFTGNELYPLVNYAGYNFLGEKHIKAGLQSAFNTADPRIAAYIYQQGGAYISDQVIWKDIEINVGLRLDIHHSNQYQLKDIYSFKEIRSVGSLRQSTNPLGKSLPASISDDYLVYVDDINQPNQILGFRKPGQAAEWFDEFGKKLQTADALIVRTSNGQLAPMFVNNDAVLHPSDFKTAKTQWAWQPAFRFKAPINQYALFYGLYQQTAQWNDALMQTNLLNYIYYKQSGQSFQAGNADLTPMKSLYFETGFRQQLHRSLLVNLSVSLQKVSNIPEQKSLIYVFPYNYSVWLASGNLNTQKMQLHSEWVGKVCHLAATYTLQSVTTDVLEDNLAYTFHTAFDYRHQMNQYIEWVDVFPFKKYLKNISVKLMAIERSGQPYSNTALQNAYNGIVGHDSYRSDNKRMPWFSQVDVSIAKQIHIQHKSACTLYAAFQNIFNQSNAWGVFSRTGNYKNDGYLVSDAGKQASLKAYNSQNYSLLYTLQMLNPQLQALPFSWRAGMVWSLGK